MNDPEEVSGSTAMDISTKPETWEALCQRIQASSNLFEIRSIWQDMMRRFETMRVGTDGFSTRVVTLLSISTVLITTKTKSTSDNTSVEHQVRHSVLEWIHKLVQIYANSMQSHPTADPTSSLLPHAMNIIAVAMDVLVHDYELNAVLASRIVFDLYKSYRNTLSTDYVQAYLDFVISLYRNLPNAVARNFQYSMLVLPADTPMVHTPLIASKQNDPMDVEPRATDATTGNDPMDVEPKTDGATTQPQKEDGGSSRATMVVSTPPQHLADLGIASSPPTTPMRKIIYKSNASFQVLTECPLIVMLLFQLYPQYMKVNIPILIQGMMESLGIRVPAWVPPPTTPPPEHFTRARELVAAQAKTVSFLTYLLRSFANELKPYEERLAANVIYLMKTCPRESVSTRKELLVATRHLLNSEFRNGFFRLMDPMLDERLYLGSTSLSHRPDPTVIRPLAYTTLSDFVQQARTLLTMPQMSRVVGTFSRVLHDASVQLPLATQYTAVRTLLSTIDLIYQNKDPDPQLGRDMLVRLLYTLVDKLQALNDAYPDVERAEQLRDQEGDCATDQLRSMASIPRPALVGFDPAPTDTVREVQSLIRTIIVGQKNIILYICSYRGQRLERAAKESGTSPSSTRESIFLPPPGSNEEVASALLKVTHTEAAIIDQYIQVALSSMRRLSSASTEVSSSRLVLGEKPVSELHRDALTYFAATFTAMDGYTLRRSLGRRIELLVDTIVEDPLTMIVPRHLLGSNSTTSYEFCNILLDYLVEHLDLLHYRQRPEMIFFDEATNHDLTELEYVKQRIHSVTQLPADSAKRHTNRSNTLLQLFERVFKSLSVYPDNEAVVRKHLRQILVVCLRTSMEHTSQWPENYAVLLRYVFRSISAGKFEDSYRELLSLIPTVLNGLCRVVCSAEDSVLRNTAIELCLTIPARLSSLLPHMNLLLRIIIPALDSNINELVNLGLRTLEFWVDNLNPQFLYPEMSKGIALFSTLMQSLSHHLRPAPYPYGLLTLRLLGKLGGKNRQFLRDPMQLNTLKNWETSLSVTVKYPISLVDDSMSDFDEPFLLTLPLPLNCCVDTIRSIALTYACDEFVDDEGGEEYDDSSDSRIDPSTLWDNKIDELDIASYSKVVLSDTKKGQAVASLAVLKAAIQILFSVEEPMDIDGKACSRGRANEVLICNGLLYASMIDSTKVEATSLLQDLFLKVDRFAFADCLSSFLAEPSTLATKVGLDLLMFILKPDSKDLESGSNSLLLDTLIRSLCESCCSCSWGKQCGLRQAIIKMTSTLGSEWSRKYEVILVNASLLAVKSVPRELSEAAINALSGFVGVCITLYGDRCCHSDRDENFVWDIMAVLGVTTERVNPDDSTSSKYVPSEDVFKIIIYEMTSHQPLVRFASRFLLNYFVSEPSGSSLEMEFMRDRIDLIRRVLFSRILRLLPLSHQVGTVEGLATVVKLFPYLFPLTDQHVLTFLSELLKMASVADKEMSDEKLKEIVVDKDGYVPLETGSDRALYPRQSSALFYRRECVLTCGNMRVVILPELPVGIQFRVSTILLLHAIIKNNSDLFFDADPTTPIGNIRPHVVSLLFRSLVSTPLKAVNAAHYALRDVLALSIAKTAEGDDSSSSHTRLPKELLQTCIRPVLMQLREYTRLSVPLLRGLSRLLSLLSSWFNKTLGEKLLDHLRRWTEPSVIAALKIWKEGEEPLVAVAIVDMFSSLPHASQFVEHLVKTCIKLESTLHLFKARFVESPYRRPLARYLNKHAQFAISFFFPRFKTPMYSELFQYVVELEESVELRESLSNKQYSDLLLHVCFERPLAIIRSEKGVSPGNTKNSLSLHGIGKPSSSENDPGILLPMNTETLEMQHQGLRLVYTLMSYIPNYFRDHNDIVRACRWLWRSKGRLLRQQYEEVMSPRFHSESKQLAVFRMNYAKSAPSEALDILFELFRVFLQPSTVDFALVSRFLVRMVTEVLTIEQKKKVFQRFFASITGDTNEEIKVLGIQFLVVPMVAAEGRQLRRNTCIMRNDEQTCTSTSGATMGNHRDHITLIDSSVLEKFVGEVLFQDGVAISCGLRLKIELLRLLDLFVEYNFVEIELHKKSMVDFCLGVLKSESVTCRCWSYVVLSRISAVYDLPAKLARDCYFALLKIQDERNLVRTALDLLVPVLPFRLVDPSKFEEVIDDTIHLLADEGISIPHLAQVNQTIVRNFGIFEAQCNRIAPHMIRSLDRLALLPSGPQENRYLAVNIVELILIWSERVTEMGPLLAENADLLCNFLIRLKFVIAELPVDSRHHAIPRIQSLLETLLSKESIALQFPPIEKTVRKETKSSFHLLAYLEVVSTVVKCQHPSVIYRNAPLIQDLLEDAVHLSRNDVTVQKELRSFASCARTSSVLSSMLLGILDNAIVECQSEQAGGSTSDRSADRSRSKDQPTASNNPADSSLFILFALSIIADICKENGVLFNVVGTTLLSVAKSLSKAHLTDATAKQRQGSSNTMRSSASDVRYQTPTIGILEEAYLRQRTNSAKHAKARYNKDLVVPDAPIRSLILLLSVFESCGCIGVFSESRNSLLLLVTNILEASDNVQVLMISVRCVGKWVLSDGFGPLTTKEQSSLLGRIAALDLRNFGDDVATQPLWDLIAYIAIQFGPRKFASDMVEVDRIIASCVLNANPSTRRDALNAFMLKIHLDDPAFRENGTDCLARIMWLFCRADFEGLGARFWIVAFVDVLLDPLLASNMNYPLQSLSDLAHGSIPLCLEMFNCLLRWVWTHISNDHLRVQLITAMESLLSKPYHTQFLGPRSGIVDTRCLTPIRALLSTVVTMNPIPIFDTNLLLSLAENYSCWYEVVLVLEKQYFAFKEESRGEVLVSALRHCYQHLGDSDAWRSLAKESVVLTTTVRALSLDIYDCIDESVKHYSELMEGAESEFDPTDFEMDIWEDRWILLQKELCQFQVVSEFASASGSPELQMECAWKAQDWPKVRSLCSSSGLFAAVERGDPVLKMSETMLAVADGKLSEVENLHAQTAQLCLYKWQILPQLSSGSQSHFSLLHFFHRLVEIRESGQIMVETGNHTSGKSLPDLKNLLSAWRHRLPNEWEKLSIWDEVFVWRAHMFSSISSNFSWCEPETLATQHDRPWTALRMAKTARKQGLRDVTQLLLSKVTDEQAMNVSDAYSKVRERILTFYNPDSDEKSKQERQGGLSLINTTNLSFFDSSQNSEIFRLRAIFLQSLQGRSKANQAFCHSVQICPTHARAWDSWGELCSSLGAAAEKQIEQSGGSSADVEANKDAVKKVRQYLAQAMGCYIEAIQIDGHEWARLRIPKCLWMLSKDGSSPGVLCQTIESRGVHLPAWVWLPWIPQLLTSLYRKEGRAIKSIFARLVKSYPQAVYYPLRTFYLERRDVDRGKSSSASASTTEPQNSVSHAEDLMSLLRRSHASLWSALEPCLEELIVKFRHSYEEELLATIVVLLERTETHFGNFGKKDDESAVISSVWKTLGKIAVKFFRQHERDVVSKDPRAEKTAKFKMDYKCLFESDFHVSSVEPPTSVQTAIDCPIGLNEIIEKLRCWKRRLEDHVLASPDSISLVESSHSLAMFGVSDSPDLWPGSCDPLSLRLYSNDRECTFDSDATTTPSTTSSSAAAARKAAKLAADAASEAARREGVGGDYGGGSSCIEIPGQYVPHTSAWTDIRPSPELHVKLLKFEPTVAILRRNDTLVRRVGMVGSDGKIYYFLLQIGVSYLARTDERTSQTLYILDKVLRKDMKSSRALISVQSHPVIPVAQRLRLMYEPESRSSLEDVYRELCAKKNVHHADLSVKFSDDVKRILAEKVAVEPKEGTDLVALEKSVRLDVFSTISSSELCDNSMLSTHSMGMFSGAEPFYQFKRIFAQQWATNCLLQYTFSAMDRTPSKVVFDYGSGRVHAPEFRISYTNQGVMDNPHTPFRLTPNLVSLIGFPFLDSRYTTSLALTAGAMQQYQLDLDPVFRLLMRDDLIAYFTKSLAKSDTTTVEMEKQLAGSVARNVSILHARFAECAPNAKGVVTKEHRHVDQRVRDLMDSARNPENLCLMPGSYQGWL